MKIRLFISSSTEQLPFAMALQKNLELENFEVNLWSNGVHGTTEYNLESLIAETKECDFAIFICGLDDKAIIRGKKIDIIRDNVLFELGLFIGKLGKDRCIILENSEHLIQSPSDLDGLTKLRYDLPSAGADFNEGFKPIIEKITNHIENAIKVILGKFSLNDIRLLNCCIETSMPSSQAYKANARYHTFEEAYTPWDYKDDKLCMRYLKLLDNGLIKCEGSTEIESTGTGKLLSNTLTD